MKFVSQKTILAFVLVVALAAGLRLFHLGTKSLWSDEGVIWWIAQGAVEHDAPASYAWTLGWGRSLFGWTEVAGRFPSVVYGTLSVVVVFCLGRIFFNNRVAWTATLAASLSAYLVPISQELRVYSLLGLLLLLVLGIFLNIAKKPKIPWEWWLALLSVGLAGQYTHCFFIFVLAYLGVILTWRRGVKIGGIFWLITGLVLLLSWPELANTISLAGSRPHARAADLGHLWANFVRLARSYFAFFFGDYLTNLPGGLRAYLPLHPGRMIAATAMVATSAIIIIFGIIPTFKSLKNNHFPVFIQRTLIGMVVVFTLLFLVIDVSSTAHLIFVYVPLLIFLSVNWERKRGRFKGIVTALFFLLTAVSISDYYHSPQWACERADWRAAGEWVRQEYEVGDGVLFFRSRDAYYTLRFYAPDLKEGAYYLPRHDPEAEKDTTLKTWWTTTSPQEKVHSLLKKHARVWVLESFPPGSAKFCLKDLGGHSRDFGKDLRVRLIERVR